MRIALFGNERAGRSWSLDELHQAIERGGHTVVQKVPAHRTDSERLSAMAEAVVAAGGDGTVARTARVAAAAKVPMAILPLGTANNIARTFRIQGSIQELVDGWSRATPVAVDLGIARTARGEHTFFESVGGGLMPAVIDSMRADRDAGQFPTKEIARALYRYREIVPLLPPQLWTLSVDGVAFEEELILVEVLNIPSIGPNLVLSADASPLDGRLSMVLVGTEHRHLLTALLEAHAEGGHSATLRVMHGKEIVISGRDAMHIDDRVYAAGALGQVSIGVQAGALTLLT